MNPATAPRIDGDDLRDQVRALVTALGEHTRSIAPLVTVAPALVEMASAYTASKGGVTLLGRWAARGARAAGLLAAWGLRVGGAAALVWAVFHHRWDVFLGAPKP